MILLENEFKTTSIKDIETEITEQIKDESKSKDL